MAARLNIARRALLPFAGTHSAAAAPVGRALGAAMSKSLNQQIIVENVGGAAGNIGVARAAKAAPDGYTLLMHNFGMAIAPSLYAKLDFHTLTDFQYIGLVVYAPMVVLARAGVR